MFTGRNLSGFVKEYRRGRQNNRSMWGPSTAARNDAGDQLIATIRGEKGVGGEKEKGVGSLLLNKVMGKSRLAPCLVVPELRAAVLYTTC